MRYPAALLLAVVVSGAIFACVSAPANAEPAGDPLLYVSSDVLYDVRPDAGGVFVTWNVHIVNNDPATAYQDYGYIYYYISYGVPVLRGAEDVQATSGGSPLSAGVSEIDTNSIMQRADVTFDSELFYGSSYDFTLSYRVPAARYDGYVVTSHYAYFPAIGAGDASTVTVTTPVGADWESSVQATECEAQTEREYTCGPADNPQTAAVAEVIRKSDVLTLGGPVQTRQRALFVLVHYAPGEFAWASRVVELTTLALPVLEQLFGVPVPGPRDIDVEARGQRDLLGYGGLFGCNSPGVCSIGLSLAGSDAVLLHELAHFWTHHFNERWLAEGFAEFMARRAASELGMSIEYYDDPSNVGLTLQLDDWRPRLLLMSATTEQRQLEGYGYQRSRQFVEALERVVGLSGLQAANVAAKEEEEIDSRKYFDLIEDATGLNLEQEFREWVFTPADEAALDKRRASRERFKALLGQLHASDVDIPEALEVLMDSWSFDMANSVMSRAEHALYAYRVAEGVTRLPKSPLERFGLRGRDPAALLLEAKRLFEEERFEASIDASAEVKRSVDEAERVGLYRLSIAVTMFAIVAGTFCYGLLYHRRHYR